MAKKKNVIGGWAFLVGVVLALGLAGGLVSDYSLTITWILVIAGIIVGLFNIADAETSPFLISGVVLIIASALGRDPLIVIGYVASTLDALLLLFVPATVVVAVRHVFQLSKN